MKYDIIYNIQFNKEVQGGNNMKHAKRILNSPIFYNVISVIFILIATGIIVYVVTWLGNMSWMLEQLGEDNVELVRISLIALLILCTIVSILLTNDRKNIEKRN